jgi:hypothetical protein
MSLENYSRDETLVSIRGEFLIIFSRRIIINVNKYLLDISYV